jgi:hypothetical protein
MDFGIARMQTSDVRTQSGTMMGSPKYMSPEQVGGHSVDHAATSSRWARCCTRWWPAQPAFAGSNLGQLLTAILHGTPVPASQARPACRPALDAGDRAGDAEEPAARYQDAAEMARDLAQCRTPCCAPALAPARHGRRPVHRQRHASGAGAMAADAGLAAASIREGSAALLRARPREAGACGPRRWAGLAADIRSPPWLAPSPSPSAESARPRS